jgi:hypothetical protein
MELNLNGYFPIFLISLLVLVIYQCKPPYVLLTPDVKKATSKYRYPPGPKGLPFIGVAHLLPPVFAGQVTSKWADQYGEMMTLQLGGMRWIFLNSSRTAKEILERRSAVILSKTQLMADN